MPTLFNIVDSHESLSVRRFKWQNYGDKVEEGLRQTPSAQSTLLFNTVREDLDEDTRDVDDAIASLRAKLEFLERGKRRIEQLQSRVSAVLAPIRRLSDEILLRIFLHSIDGTPLNVEYLSGAYMNFSFVHPTWARVFDDLSRSLFVPSLEIHDVSCNDVISFAMEQCARRLLHVDFKGDVASWQHLLLFPDRLSSLQIAVTRQQWNMLLPIAGSLQHVHSITLDAQQDSSAEPWCDVLPHIPNLTSVSFIGSSQQGRLTSVPLGRLTHFSDTRPYADVSPDLYLDILENTPSLVSVDLRSKESAATANPIQRNLVMPNLRRLTIGDGRCCQALCRSPPGAS
ncbi:hypothetical protein CPB85DRAFT_1249624 [Mucidula mucida]|nr:hypothetical protein CPB85DRAFT_1249624 [Mucidula mucida]